MTRSILSSGDVEVIQQEEEWDYFLEPFNRLSPFRRPIGTGAIYAGDNHVMTISWNSRAFNMLSVNNGIGFNTYSNKQSDPLRTIVWYGGGGGANLPITVRAPWMRNPDPTGDEHDSATILYDTADGQDRFLEFSRFRGGNISPWTARDCNIINPRGDGRDAGASASDIAGFGLIARSHELDPSHGPILRTLGRSLEAIDHPAQLANRYVWPAKHTDGGCGKGYACDGPIPYGTLFALPADTDIDDLGLSALGNRLAAQMMHFGVYAVDHGGQNCRGDQFISASVRTDFMNSMKIIMPLMRAVLNNESTATQPTCSGGGDPLAPNGAYDA